MKIYIRFVLTVLPLDKRLLIAFIVIYKAPKWRFDQHVRFWLWRVDQHIRFWYLSHISKCLRSINCSCCIFILCGCRQQRLWRVCTFTRLAWVLNSDTAMGTGTKSNVLVHLIYSFLLVIIYLAWFEISKGLIGCIFITMIMFPCGMLSTKFKIHC